MPKKSSQPQSPVETEPMAEVLELYGPWFQRPDGRFVDASKIMTKEQIDAIPRKSASQLIAEIPGASRDDRWLLLAVETAMNLEWWRGYYAAPTSPSAASSTVTVPLRRVNKDCVTSTADGE